MGGDLGGVLNSFNSQSSAKEKKVGEQRNCGRLILLLTRRGSSPRAAWMEPSSTAATAARGRQPPRREINTYGNDFQWVLVRCLNQWRRLKSIHCVLLLLCPPALPRQRFLDVFWELASSDFFFSPQLTAAARVDKYREAKTIFLSGSPPRHTLQFTRLCCRVQSQSWWWRYRKHLKFASASTAFTFL